MDVAAVFALSLIGGYLFAAHWRFTSFAIRRTDGHHLYFRAAFYAVAWFVASFLLRVILISYWEGYREFELAFVEYISPTLKEPRNERQAELVISALYSCGFGPVLAVLLNLITTERLALQHNLNSLDKLLYRAQRANMPVQLTLSTGKIYVGLVRRITDPERPPAMIALLPMYSGYRNKYGQLKLTTDYEKIYETLENDEARARLKLSNSSIFYFTLEVRADLVVSASIFTPTIFNEFNPGWRDNLAEPSEESRTVVEIVQKPKLRVIERPASDSAQIQN